MPTYDYKCEECEEEFVALRKIDERKTCDCPFCTGVGKQTISAPKVMLDPNSFPGEGMKWARERKKLNGKYK